MWRFALNEAGNSLNGFVPHAILAAVATQHLNGMGMTASPRRAAAIVGINLIVFLAMVEVVGVLFHYFDSGRLFYLSRPAYEFAGDAPPGQLTADVLNPYFGPSH
jgi:hypothetical protein